MNRNKLLFAAGAVLVTAGSALGVATPAAAAGWVPGPNGAYYSGPVSCGSTRVLTTHATFGSGTNEMRIVDQATSNLTISNPGSGTHYLVSYGYHSGYYNFYYASSISGYGYSCET